MSCQLVEVPSRLYEKLVKGRFTKEVEYPSIGVGKLSSERDLCL